MCPATAGKPLKLTKNLKNLNSLYKKTELPDIQTYSPDIKWYAAKVFLNRSKSVSETLQKSGIEIYRQEVIPSLIFLHCDEETIIRVNDTFRDKMHIYQNVAKTRLYAIPEKEMASFILVTSNDYNYVTLLGEDREEYHQGDRVRVKEGPFKGAEGHIKRIKKDRKLIVSINGVVAVALAYIPPQYLEKIAPAPGSTSNTSNIVSGNDNINVNANTPSIPHPYGEG